MPSSGFEPSPGNGKFSADLHSIRRVFVYCSSPLYLRAVGGIANIPGVEDLHVEKSLDDAVGCLQKCARPFDLIILRTAAVAPDDGFRLFAEARRGQKHENTPCILYVWSPNAQEAVCALKKEYGNNLWVGDDDWEYATEARELGRIFCEAAGIPDTCAPAVGSYISTAPNKGMQFPELSAPRVNLHVPELQFEKALIINDEARIATFLSRTIQLLDGREKKCEILTACDPLEGTELFRQNCPGLAVVNYMMPRMNGVQVIDELRAIEKAEGRSPAVIILESGSPDLLEEYLRSKDRKTRFALTMACPGDICAMANTAGKIEAAHDAFKDFDPSKLDLSACRLLAASKVEKACGCREDRSRPLTLLELGLLEAHLVCHGVPFFSSTDADFVPEGAKFFLTDIIIEQPHAVLPVLERACELRSLIDSLGIEHSLLQMGSSFWTEMTDLGVVDLFCRDVDQGDVSNELIEGFLLSDERARSRRDLGTLLVPSDIPCEEWPRKWALLHGLIQTFIQSCPQAQGMTLTDRDRIAAAEYILQRMNNLVIDQFSGAVSGFQFAERAREYSQASRLRMEAIGRNPRVIFEDATWKDRVES